MLPGDHGAHSGTEQTCELVFFYASHALAACVPVNSYSDHLLPSELLGHLDAHIKELNPSIWSTEGIPSEASSGH